MLFLLIIYSSNYRDAERRKDEKDKEGKEKKEEKKEELAKEKSEKKWISLSVLKGYCLYLNTIHERLFLAFAPIFQFSSLMQ